MEEELPTPLHSLWNETLWNETLWNETLWNETIQGETFQHGHAMTSTWCILFGAVFLLGFVGNLLVMMVIVRTRHMHNTPYFFIFNLALADFLFIVFCVPGNLLSNIFNTWVLGLFMCKAFNYMQQVCMNVSVYTLLAMSVERYIVMRRDSSFQRIMNTCGKVILACIWVFSLAVSIPSAVYAILHESQMCIEHWPSEKIRKIYYIFAHFIMSYFFPMVMMTICHLWIWLKFHRQVVGKRIDPNELIRLNNWRKWEKMILVMVSVFLLFWLPLIIASILLNFSYDFSHGEVYLFSYVLLGTHWLTNLTYCVYPIIYVFFKRNFREGFIHPRDELLTAEIELRQMLPPPTQLPPSVPFHKEDAS
ncbi:unnamed protein product [Darwinula stevensoni]|uniref:G-protein coupled receptors family 1 profile domain-containing protein n=1 Tax=Darwinula stevensoni TaxID=69355 RepID=A0A7R9FRX1_9CRUS|nr:unnamed protein product [Darwinula stevensoni]CAG0902581.1 unnamed protein product [Darwinula stevensoni]